MAEAIKVSGVRLSFDGLQRPIVSAAPVEPYQQEALKLGTFRMQGRFTPRYVSNKLRREFGWTDLPSNARLARRRRRIERLVAQRVGRR